MTGRLVAGLLVALLAAGVAWALRHGRARAFASPEDAAAAIERALPGFAVADLVLGADGTGALAVGRDGRLAAARRRLTGTSARAVTWAAVRSAGGATVVETGAGRVTLAGVDALDLRRLAGQMAFPFAGVRSRRGEAGRTSEERFVHAEARRRREDG